MKHRIPLSKPGFVRSNLIAMTGFCLSWGLAVAHADETIRHTVVKGDTLWSLSNTYLKSPWLWTELWEENTRIKHPDQLFPGDVLLISPGAIRLVRNKRLTSNKLGPEIRVTPLHAITTLEPGVIMPFLTQSIILEPEVLEKSAYVLQGVNGKLILGKYSRFYATGLNASDATEYLLFGKGKVIKDNLTGLVYGTEGVHLGRARVIRREGDIGEMEIVRANQDISPGEFLLPADKPGELPRYFPRRPDTLIDARIISIPKGVHEAGRRDVVIVSNGKLNGLRDGDLLEVFSFGEQIRDPLTNKPVTLPDNKIATLMVIKAYEKVSYALLVEASIAVKVGDRASSP